MVVKPWGCLGLLALADEAVEGTLGGEPLDTGT